MNIISIFLVVYSINNNNNDDRNIVIPANIEKVYPLFSFFRFIASCTKRNSLAILFDKKQTASLQKHDMCLLKQINLTALYIDTANIDIDNLHYILASVCLEKKTSYEVFYVLDRRVVNSLLVLVIIIVNQIQHSILCVF